MASRIAARNSRELERAKNEYDGMLDQLRRAQTDEHENVIRLDAELKKKEVEVVELKGEVVELKVEVAELKKEINRLEAIIMRILDTMA